MRIIKRLILYSVISLLIAAASVNPADAARLKDIAKVQGVRSNQLIGYGLVVGLAGTGDSNKSEYTIQSVVNMLKSFGLTVDPTQIKPKNIAAVMITAQLPPFVRPGDNIDITVSSIGDAKSLQGGTLLQTPLRAGNGQIYAVGQGVLSIGGFSAASGGSSQQKNFPTVGLIPNGAIVEREVTTQLGTNGTISLSLNQPDFTTASRVVEIINRSYGPIANARDAGTVTVAVPNEYSNNLVGFIANIEVLPVTGDQIAKIVINERTGTVVIGAHVTIGEVAIAQGGLSVKITKNKEVSQPPSLSGGSTVAVNKTQVEASEDPAHVIVLPATAKVSDIVSALNAVGATPRDIIAILQAMKSAGALQAELQII